MWLWNCHVLLQQNIPTNKKNRSWQYGHFGAFFGYATFNKKNKSKTNRLNKIIF